ncbi:uncharacterized protein MELLADRAFT_108142 [Melampsora larici-populina 98AG31]|uniref:Uncharacterized protein n=1 Tax=Melampsora larici-populina (strain 98AG31 / pathotype 3-4-7) TaxID=747676 RepID=F4RS38_MELLP|nr:uncharacterized protein MELLADRAFT_108142 [Melampsora larici-populina 98AG31]EGG04843.1 hypothetical protein MELLADRAFT_108142 [Melampsora larici-populina 98AG31]
MLPAPTLPVEIVTLIIMYWEANAFHFAVDGYNSADNRFLHQTSVKSLLSLRLLGRSWADAIPPFVYKSLHLQSPWAHSYMSDLWAKGVVTSSFPGFHLRRLALDRVMYLPEFDPVCLYESTEDRLFRKLELEYKHYNTKSIFMKDTTGIISLCGLSLTDLKLSFTSAVGFSNNLALAIRGVDNLKTFFVEGDKKHNIMNNANSLISILNHTNQLESLLLKFGTLSSLTLRTGALPKLMHFWVTLHCKNISAVKNFCQAPGRQIKLLEFSPTIYMSDSEAIISSMKDTLGGLFIEKMPDHMPDRLRYTRFPSLRVFRSMYVNATFQRPNWFNWHFFETVSVFITSYAKSGAYWRKLLEEVADIKFPPRLKHFIFITGHETVVLGGNLVDLFKRFGIRCQFKSQLRYTQVLASINYFEQDAANGKGKQRTR